MSVRTLLCSNFKTKYSDVSADVINDGIVREFTLLKISLLS